MQNSELTNDNMKMIMKDELNEEDAEDAGLNIFKVKMKDEAAKRIEDEDDEDLNELIDVEEDFEGEHNRDELWNVTILD